MNRKVPPGLAGIPNLGPVTAHDLGRLGIHDRPSLAKADAQRLYDRLARLDGRRHDPCVLDTFHAIVDFANGGPARPWWHYSRIRLAQNQARKRRAP
ncbi:MAG: mitomycin resistance protein [Euryarchaeota archaeon]|nr:mitomycin resistance protein [Euryarchaeota archaeon]